jgi:hypothetical protein
MAENTSIFTCFAVMDAVFIQKAKRIGVVSTSIF